MTVPENLLMPKEQKHGILNDKDKEQLKDAKKAQLEEINYVSKKEKKKMKLETMKKAQHQLIMRKKRKQDQKLDEI